MDTLQVQDLLRAPHRIRPDRWYDVTVPLQATDQTVQAGHVLGLILQQRDNEYSTPSTTGATLQINLRGSALTLPLVGWAGLPPAGSSAPLVHTAAVAGFARRAPSARVVPAG